MASKKPEKRIITTEDILLKLCHSVTSVLTEATHHEINYSSMAQRISKTCLRPDIGCFVLFDGAFSGLVVINFTAEAAMEVYSNYLLNMGISEDELAKVYTSDEVGNVMGELMNQILGDFTKKVSQELQSSITQSQPKMLTLNRQVRISVDTDLVEIIQGGCSQLFLEEPAEMSGTEMAERGQLFHGKIRGIVFMHPAERREQQRILRGLRGHGGRPVRQGSDHPGEQRQQQPPDAIPVSFLLLPHLPDDFTEQRGRPGRFFLMKNQTARMMN